MYRDAKYNRINKNKEYFFLQDTCARARLSDHDQRADSCIQRISRVYCIQSLDEKITFV